MSRPATPPAETEAEPAPSVRKQHLLQAAARVFSERGYRAATLRQIAEEAGILAGSVYHHVESKEALYIAVQHEGYRRMAARVQAALQGLSDPWERLEAACRAHLHEMLDGSPLASVTGAGLQAERDGPLPPSLQAERDAYEDLLRGLIAALPLRPGLDRRLLRLQLLGALNGTRHWWRPDGPATLDEVARQLVLTLR